MARLRNISGADLYLYHPPDHPASMLVEAGQVVQVPGEAKTTADAYVIGDRAFPRTTWQLVKDPPPNQSRETTGQTKAASKES